jgi:hypothetical protein
MSTIVALYAFERLGKIWVTFSKKIKKEAHRVKL